MKLKLILFLLLASVVSAFAQKKYEGEQLKAIEYLESKRKDFKASKNDSSFVNQNGDQKYYVTTLVRGDQAEDLEEQIYKAKPGDVVGPFDGEKNFYLLKILSMDSLKRTKARLVRFFPKGEYTSDTAKFSKLVSKYVDNIKKGKEYSKMLVKEEGSIGVRNKGTLSFWEGQTSKEYYDLAYDRKTNDPYVIRVGQEIQVLYIIEEKRNAAYKAKVVSLVKKVK
ncbi:MAG TPA: hypothetical protein VNB90_01235 [Cytophagaceae bacterium]|nr:hypothetical protein [Cytophagaceae bacterium]